jgi:hypothetical protein
LVISIAPDGEVQCGARAPTARRTHAAPSRRKALPLRSIELQDDLVDRERLAATIER